MMNLTSDVVYGSVLANNSPPPLSKGTASVILSGKHSGRESSFGLTDDILSRHILLLGGTGTGKTNLFYHIVRQLKEKMTSSDVMMIFDSKGDFCDKFYDPKKDSVIGNSAKYRQASAKWSIHNEITADGWDNVSISQNVQEICKSFFARRMENNNNPFFPAAASDLLGALMISFIRKGLKFTNADLKYALDTMTAKDFHDTFSAHKDLQTISTYIDPRAANQSQGVLSEVYSTMRDILTGVFADAGDFSMRRFIRAKQGRTVFLEYDLAIGDVLAPVYSLLFDLALKEALGRTKSQGNVYLIADELKLLPRLRHLDDGINFGRSLGLKILAGLQSIRQLDAIYDKEAQAHNAIAGFSTVAAFRSSDPNTREYVSGMFGKNAVVERLEHADGTAEYKRHDGFVVEDWDIISLETGEAVVGMPEIPPFRFKFKEYK
ncbi:MAG: type IV secretion system DNA-binding domain-containing protein [Synergistaceae bacterium]|nr:type IV secretion system DNA-binding domain-containing protein [Synergistaceae bacterium]